MLPFYVLVISYIWKNLGYDVVLWMAGLSAIPAALYEAGKSGRGRGVEMFYEDHTPESAPVPFLRSWYFSVLNAF